MTPDNLNLGGLEQQYGLPSGLLSSVMQTESGGDPLAQSPAGAQGLFQFVPATAKQYGIDPLDPTQAADGAARMYADLSKKYNGDLPSMLAAYNWGQGNLDRQGLENAPKETRDYINKVTKGLQTTPEMAAEKPLPQVADSGQVMSDITPNNRPSLDDIFASKDAQKPSLDEIFSGAASNPQAAQEPVDGTGAARTGLEQGLQGATFGFADEVTNPLGASIAALAEDPLGTLKSIATGKTPEVSDALNESIAGVKSDSKARLAAQVKEHPLESLATNVGGALLTGGAGAETKAGSAIVNLLRGGNTASRIVKGALAGATSGALYGAGTADEGDRTQGAQQGALSGAVVGGAIPGAGAALSDVGGTVGNVAKGVLARSPQSVQDAAEAFKSGASGLYDQMRKAGATFTPQAAQGLITDLKSALASQDFLPSLNPKTLGVVNDLDNIVARAGSGGNLQLNTLDQIRRQLGKIGATEDGVSAGKIRNVIDDFVNNAGAKDLQSGSTAAVGLLNQGRKQYAQASKFETISDILTNAGGDPNKIKANLTRYLNNNSGKPKGFTKDEIAALKNAATSTGTEKILKMAGKFGLDLGSSTSPGNTVLPILTGLTKAGAAYAVPGGATAVAGGTIARQAQKYAARAKVDALLKLIQKGGGSNKTSAISGTVSPALSALSSIALPNYQTISMQSPLKSFAGRP